MNNKFHLLRFVPPLWFSWIAISLHSKTLWPSQIMFNKATKLTMRTHGKLVRNHVSLFLNTRPHGFWNFSMISETFGISRECRKFLDSPLDASKVRFAHSWWLDASHFTETRIEDQSHWTNPADATIVNAIRSQIFATLQPLFLSSWTFLFVFRIAFKIKIKSLLNKHLQLAPSEFKLGIFFCVFEKKNFQRSFPRLITVSSPVRMWRNFILLLFSYPTSEGDVWKIF